MKQIIYLGGKKAREYDGVDEPEINFWGGHNEQDLLQYQKDKDYYSQHIKILPVFDVIGDCDWKKGEVKTEGVDYTTHKIYQQSWDESRPVIVPIPKKQEGEEWDDAFAAAPGSRFLHPITKEWFKNNFTITRKS